MGASCLQDVKPLLKKSAGRIIKLQLCNNGGEYTSSEFVAYFTQVVDNNQLNGTSQCKRLNAD